MPTTRLGLFGLPARRSTFVAKAAAVVDQPTGKQGGGKKDDYPEGGYLRHLYPDIKKKEPLEVLTLKKDLDREEASRQTAIQKARAEERQKERDELELVNLLRLDAGLTPLESRFESFSEALDERESRLALKKKILLLLAAS